MANGEISVIVVEGVPADVSAILQKAAAPVPSRYPGWDDGVSTILSAWRVLWNLYPIPPDVTDAVENGQPAPNRDWMARHWNVERLLGGAQLRRETDTRGRIEFVTAYVYPTAWVDRVAADHRSLTFHHFGAVEGMEEAYHAVYRRGRRVRRWEQGQGRKPPPELPELYTRCEEWGPAADVLTALIRKRVTPDLLIRRAEVVVKLLDEWPGYAEENGYRREQILADLNRAVELDPTPAALVARGRHHFGTTGGGKAALKDLNAAVRLAPTFADAYVARAQLRHIGMKYRQSLIDANRALRLEPDHPAGHMWRASSLLHLRRYTDAVRSADRLLALDPGNASGHMTRSRALRRLGRYAEALAEMDEANCWVGLDFADWWMGERARSLVPLGRGNEVLDYCEKMLNGNYLPGGRTAVWELRGHVYTLMEQWRKALADYNRILREKPSSFPVKLLRIYALVQLGQVEKALDAVMTLLKYSRRKARAFLRDDLTWALELVE